MAKKPKWQGVAPPVADPVDPPPDPNELLMPAAQTLDHLEGTLNASLNNSLGLAMAGQMAAGSAVQQDMADKLATAASAASTVHDALNAHLMGQLGSAFELGATAGAFPLPQGSGVPPSLDPFSPGASAPPASDPPGAAGLPPTGPGYFVLVQPVDPNNASSGLCEVAVGLASDSVWSIVGNLGPPRQVIGPFPDLASAQAAFPVCDLSPPPPPPSPPPPIVLSPPPPPPAAGVPGLYCIRDATGNNSVADIDPANPPAGYTVVGGPYPDQETADAQCTNAPPPPPPSPPSPPSPPPPGEGDITPILEPPASGSVAGIVSSVLWPDWSSATVCSDLGTAAAAFTSYDKRTLSVQMGLYVGDGQGGYNPVTPLWLQGLNVLKLPSSLLPTKAILGGVVSLIFGSGGTAALTAIQSLLGDPANADVTMGFGDMIALVLRVLSDSVGDALGGFSGGRKCPVAVVGYYRVLVTMLGIAQAYLRADLGDVIQTLEYARSYFCPTDLPGQGEVDASYLAGLINVGTWECWTRANDNLPGPRAVVLDASRSRTSKADVVDLFLRGQLDQDGLAKELRSLGYLRDAEIQQTIALTERLPDQGQAYQWQALGALDAGTVARYQLDTGIDQLAEAPYAQWVQATGYGPDALAASWRSHWLIPGTGEMVQALRRLRPDITPPELAVTKQDVDYFMGANQVHPWWRQRLQAIQTLPLGRREATQAYTYGQIGDTDAVRALLDTGYSRQTADTVLATYQARQKQHFRASKWLRYVVAGALGKGEAVNRLSADGCPLELAGQLVAEAVFDFQLSSREQAVKAIRSYYVSHSVDPVGAQAQLLALGLDPDQAQTMLAAWEIERQAHPREAKAGELTQWLDAGLITPTEAASRLLLLGYTAQDAGRIVARAQQLYSARQAARAAKTAAAQAKQAKQLTTDTEKLQRQQAAAEKARLAQLQRRQALIERTSRGRLVTVRLYAKRAGISALEAETTLGAEAQRLQYQYGLSNNEAWDTLKAAVHLIPTKGDFDLHALASSAAEAEQALIGGGGNGAAPGG